MMVSTTNDIIGFKTVRHLGIVRGITVRSRSVVGNFVGGLQSIFGGQIGAYIELAEAARQEAFDHMCAHAAQAGANAVLGMRYDENPRSATVQAISESIVIPIDERRFSFLVQQAPFFAIRVMRVMSARLKAMNERITSLPNK